MAARAGARPGGDFLNSQVLLLAAAIVLPGVVPVLFGWISGLVPMLVFCMLVLQGTGRGSILVRNAILLGGAVALPLRLIWTVLFALSLIPLGYGLNWSRTSGDNEWKAVLRGSLLLGASWLLFWAAYGMAAGVHPYHHLLELIDAGFAQSYEYYRTQGNLPPDALLYLEQAVSEIRRSVPYLLPGLLCSLVVLTAWVNLLGGMLLLNRLKPGQLPWQRFSSWRLPDWLVWPAIAGGTLLLTGGEAAGTLALTVVLVCGLLYMFQGLAVFIHLLDRWKVPQAFRILLYGMLIVQSYGLLLLALLGLADVWIDFRRRVDTTTQNGN